MLLSYPHPVLVFGGVMRRRLLSVFASLLIAACAPVAPPQTNVQSPPAVAAPPAPSAAPSSSAPASEAPVSTGERKAASEWTINEAGLDLIRTSEGLRFSAYSNGGSWLIGYGHAEGVSQGMTISKDQADTFLRADVGLCEHSVGHVVRVAVTRNEFSAMVSFCFNVGNGNLTKSSIVARLNAGDRAGAADAFLMWVKAGGKDVPHLVQRRKAERALFLS